MGWEPDGGGREGREGTGFDSGCGRKLSVIVFFEIFEEFGTCLGDMSDDFLMIFGHVSDLFRTCLGMLWGPFGTIWDRFGIILRFVGKHMSNNKVAQNYPK